jgi:hypothetical protein
MPPKKKSTQISDPSFNTGGSLSANDYKRLAVSGFSEVAEHLHEEWRGDPILITGIKLSADNSQIIEAKAILEGAFFRNEPKSIQTSKLWSFGEQLMLKIEKLDCSKFVFGSSLTSELLDYTDIPHTFSRRNGDSVSTEDLTTMGYTGFSCRLFITPTMVYRAKATLLFYPLAVADLIEEHPLAKHSEFPGLAIHRQEIELGIKASSIFDKPIGFKVMVKHF